MNSQEQVVTTHDEHALPEGDETPPAGVRVLAAVRWLLVLLAVVAAGYTFARQYGLLDTSQAHKAASAVRYQCPMHPAVIQDAPGDCPICHMALVPMQQADEPHATHDTQATPEGSGTADRDRPSALRTARAAEVELAPALSGFARVALDERGLTSIHSRVAGFLESVRVAETGRMVARGEILATLYSPELLAAQRELLAAQRWHAGAGAAESSLAPDARRRLESLGIAAEDIDAMVARGEPDRALPLRSPARGVVTRKNVTLGAYVDVATVLYELADTSRVWVVGEVSERDASQVALGARAEIELLGQAEAKLMGSVDLLYPTLDAGRRTREVRIKLAPHTAVLTPGLTGRLSIVMPSRKALTVPIDAVLDTGREQVVFLVDASGHFRARPVVVGARAAGLVEVLAGLTVGDEVVTSASFLIDADSQIRGGMESNAQLPQPSEDGHDRPHP